MSATTFQRQTDYTPGYGNDRMAKSACLLGSFDKHRGKQITNMGRNLG